MRLAEGKADLDALPKPLPPKPRAKPARKKAMPTT
jgi:hypothetical protein